jgi:hypothetical protein
MELLTEYFELQRKIYEYFGCTEAYQVIPLSDARDYYWSLTGEAHGHVVSYAIEKENVFNGDGYEDSIYTQRHLPKWVYRGSEFTMICCNPYTDDGNKFIRIFDNSKEVKWEDYEKPGTIFDC